MKSELDLFTVPRVQTSALKTEEVVYKPIASLDNASVLEFVSVGMGDTYRDLSNVYLRLKVKITKADGSDYEAADITMGVANNILHTLFSQCTIYMGGKAISMSDHNYAYRAYLESILNYGSDAMNSHMEACGFYMDTPKQFDVLDTTNVGLAKRRELIKSGSTFELVGRLHADMLNQHKFLLNNVDVRIVLSLHKPEFYTLEDSTQFTSRAKILDATLFINHVTINPPVLVSHEAVLAKSPATYPYTRVEVKSYTVASGRTSLSLDNVCIGNLPTFLLFGMVLNEAYTGKRELNPFNFQHFDMTNFYLTINGSQHPLLPLEFDFSKSPPLTMRAYNNLFKAINVHYHDRGNLITKNLFDNNVFLLAFDLTSDLSASNDCSNLLNQGTIRIE